jgi:hypothetical protein
MHNSKLDPSIQVPPFTIKTISTVQEVNEANRQFWLEQNRIREERTTDPALLEIATNAVRSEAERGLPIAWHKSFEMALADAEVAKTCFQANFSRKGGKKPKSDALQVLIVDIVSANPNISEKDLFLKLEEQISQGIIESIDTEAGCLESNQPFIRYVDTNDKEKTASVRGLKDRLSRAKTEINSR